jgi:hypothetical protein
MTFLAGFFAALITSELVYGAVPTMGSGFNIIRHPNIFKFSPNIMVGYTRNADTLIPMPDSTFAKGTIAVIMFGSMYIGLRRLFYGPLV